MTTSASKKTRIAFVSGHTDLEQASFDKHYIPQLDDALTAGDSFLLGDATGVDTQAREYLLSSKVVSNHPDIRRRITIFASKAHHVKELSSHGVRVVSSEPRKSNTNNSNDDRMSSLEAENLDLLHQKIGSVASQSTLESLIGIKNKGKDKLRYSHGQRDVRLTLMSDYDILYARSKDESKELYGHKYRERISATEVNRRRREILAAMIDGRERPIFEDEMSSWEKGEYDGCDEMENQTMMGEMASL